jgi:predicted GIY-YIG superfamily endonuclease
MKYVYILESLDSEHFYVGITGDLRARLAKHNAGEVPHTSKYRSWREFGPISRSMMPHALSRSSDT